MEATYERQVLTAADALEELLYGNSSVSTGEDDTIVSLYAGSPTNRKQHIRLGCSRSRARTVFRMQYDRHSSVSAFFGPHANKILCPDCANERTQQTTTFLSFGVGKVVEHARTFASAAGERPDFIRMRQEIERARTTLTMVEKFGAQVSLTAGESPLSRQIGEASELIRILEVAYEQASCAQQAPVEAAFRENLAAASASLPGRSNPYRLIHTRRGADISGLVIQPLREGIEPSFAHFVTDRFDEWVRHCRENPGQADSFRPDGVHPADLPDTPWNLELAATLDEWHMPPDPQLGPWGQLIANLRQLATRQLAGLYDEWAEHRRWVLDGGDAPALLLVRDVRPEPLVGTHLLDRYRLLDGVLSRFPAEETGADHLWYAQVPTFCARALDGYVAADGQVEAAGLEGVPEGLVGELSTTASALHATYEGSSRLARAAQDAFACVV